MAIREIEYFYGIVFSRLISSGISIALKELNYGTKGAYLVNDAVPIFIKYTAKRLSPWSFNLTREHQDDFQRAKDQFGVMYLAFVCGRDGVCCIEFDQFKSVLDYVHDKVEWVRIIRKKNECYAVRGSDGELKGKISDSDFPRVILSRLGIREIGSTGQSEHATRK